MDEKEKKNNRRGLIASIGVHVLIAMLAFLVSCWKQPGPPWPDSDFGVMIDFEDDLGSPSASSSATATSAPKQTQEAVEEVVEATTDVESTLEAEEVVEERVEEPTPQDVNTESEVETNSDNEVPTETETETEQEEPIDSDLLFNKSNDNGDSKDDGSNSKNNDSGKPPKGDGDGFSFEGDVGWDFIKQPPLKKNISHNGSVKVKVKITESGRLIVLGYPEGYGAFGDDDRKIIEASLQDANVYWKKGGLEEEKIAIIRFRINAQ